MPPTGIQVNVCMKEKLRYPRHKDIHQYDGSQSNEKHHPCHDIQFSGIPCLGKTREEHLPDNLGWFDYDTIQFYAQIIDHDISHPAVTAKEEVIELILDRTYDIRGENGCRVLYVNHHTINWGDVKTQFHFPENDIHRHHASQGVACRVKQWDIQVIILRAYNHKDQQNKQQLDADVDDG